MDLKSRLRGIGDRLSTIETVSRLRSAAISEGVTEFKNDGTLAVESGGTFIIANGGSIGGASWELGVNDDGTTYANIGDVLLYSHDAEPVTHYVDAQSLYMSLIDPITQVNLPMPDSTTSAVVSGSVNVMAQDDLGTIIRIRSTDVDISMVVQEGESMSVPIMMNFTSDIVFEIHASKSYRVDAEFEILYNREVPLEV